MVREEVDDQGRTRRYLEGPYHGITHKVPYSLLGLWKRLMCPRDWHAFDEVTTNASNGGEHYLHCDACELMVWIERIEVTHVR